MKTAAPSTRAELRWKKRKDVEQIHELACLVSRAMPSGAGFNSNFKPADIPSLSNRRLRDLVLRVTDKNRPRVLLAVDGGFQHLNAGGYYDGWASFVVVVAYSDDLSEYVDFCVCFKCDRDTRNLLRRDPDLATYIEETIHEHVTRWPVLGG